MGGLRETTMKVRLQQYAAQIQECKNSGMTVQAWCDAAGIGIKTYYYRQRVVRKALLEMGESEFPAIEAPASTAFAKLPLAVPKISTTSTDASINIDGIAIEVSECTSEETIKKCLKAVMSVCSEI